MKVYVSLKHEKNKVTLHVLTKIKNFCQSGKVVKRHATHIQKFKTCSQII